MPRVLIKESNFDHLQNNLAYTIIIRQHGLIIKQITNDDSLESVLITKVEPSQIKKFQLQEKDKEYFLFFEFMHSDDKTYTFTMTSLELPITVLFDKLMKIIDPSYEEKSLLNDGTTPNLSLVESSNQKTFLMEVDKFVKKTQTIISMPFIQGVKIIQIGMKGVKNGIKSITKPFNKVEKSEDFSEFLSLDVTLLEFLIPINKIYINHIDSALRFKNDTQKELQNNLLLNENTVQEPEEIEKPTIIFIHPFGLDLSIWKSYINFFYHRNYRIIAYDMRGWGGSEQHKNDNYKFSDYYDDLIALLHEKNLLENDSELILITGSLTGLMLLKKLDSKLSKRKNMQLILLSTSDRISTDLQEMVKKVPSPRTWGPLKKLGKKKIKEVLLTKEIEDQNQELIISKLLVSDNKVTMETLKNLREKDYLEGLSEKQIKEFPFERTLIILGEKDFFIPLEDEKHLESFQNVSIRVIEKANHFIAFEKPELVVKEIDDWLQST